MSQPSDLHFLSQLLLFLTHNYIAINTMSCNYGNRCSNPAVNYELCKHDECASSLKSAHHLCQMQHEADDRTDGEMHEHCKECVDKKQEVRAA